MGAGPVALPLPPFPSVAAPGTTTASTRNRRQLTLPDIGTLKLRTDRLTGSSEAKLRAPTGLTESYELVMPSSLPTTGQSLQVNSSGEMSFQGNFELLDVRKDVFEYAQPTTILSTTAFTEQEVTGLPAECKYVYMLVHYNQHQTDFSDNEGIAIYVRRHGSDTAILDAVLYCTRGGANWYTNFWAPVDTVSDGAASFDWHIKLSNSSGSVGALDIHDEDVISLWLQGTA